MCIQLSQIISSLHGILSPIALKWCSSHSKLPQLTHHKLCNKLHASAVLQHLAVQVRWKPTASILLKDECSMRQLASQLPQSWKMAYNRKYIVITQVCSPTETSFFSPNTLICFASVNCQLTLHAGKAHAFDFRQQAKFSTFTKFKTVTCYFRNKKHFPRFHKMLLLTF